MSEEKVTSEATAEPENPEVKKEDNKYLRNLKWCGSKLAAGIHWGAKNPGLIVPMLIGGFTFISGLVNMVSGNDQLEHCLAEDDRTGEKLLTKQPLTNAQILELGDRMDEGLSKGEALRDMGLLRDEKKRKI